jgi:hypothetical protein
MLMVNRPAYLYHHMIAATDPSCNCLSCIGEQVGTLTGASKENQSKAPAERVGHPTESDRHGNAPKQAKAGTALEQARRLDPANSRSLLVILHGKRVEDELLRDAITSLKAQGHKVSPGNHLPWHMM